jgi:TolA-binding protein
VGRFKYLLPLLFLSCAYFNTFYNAKSYYQEALRQQEHNPAQARELFKKSQERAALVISHHPNSRWADDALFLLGMCYYHSGQYTQALKSYEDFAVVFPKSPFNPQVKYYAALAALELGDRARGIASLSEIAKEKGPLQEDAQFQLAKASLAGGEIAEAIAGYERFLELYPRSRHRDEAILTLAEHYLELPNYEKAQGYLKKYLAKTYTSQAEALLKLAHCQLELKDPAAAAKTTQEIIDRYPEKESQAWLLLGKAFFAQGRDSEALDALKKVKQGEAGAEASYLMAKRYEESQKFELALAYYDSVGIRAPNSEYATLALRRRSLLAQLQAQEAEANPDQAQFLLAEVYYLNLNQPEAALAEYEKVYKEYPQSPYAPKALYAQAWILKEVLHRDGAEDIYRILIERYPDTPQAVKARKLLAE